MKATQIGKLGCSLILFVLFFTFTGLTYAGQTEKLDTCLIQSSTQYLFPKNELSFSFYNRNFFSFNAPRPPSPIFWGASTKATNGGMVAYEHTLFHTKKWFSINAGTDFSYWALPGDNIEGLSIFLAFKLWLPISTKFRPYLFYSPAGPTLLSQNTFGRSNLGENFIFQDLLGAGVQIGRTHALDIALIMVHYSNGDIFAQNTGFDVPVVLKIGLVLP